MILDAQTGEEMGRYELSGDVGSVNAGSPIVVGNRVFASSAYNAGAALVELDGAGAPTEVWRTRRMRNKVSGCVLWEGHVYGFDESMLKCLSWEDGSELWRVRGLGMGSVAVAGGRLIVLSSRGELIVGDASPDGFEELSREKILDGGVYWTTPVLLGGLIYCKNSLGDLVCLDHRSATDVSVAAASEQGAAPEAAVLFARHVELIGADALRRRKSLQLTGTFENTGAGLVNTAVVINWEAPNRWHMSVDIAEFGSIERCYDGEVGWVLDPFYGNKINEGDALRELADTRHFHGALEWSELISSARTTGRARFDTRDCWRVDVEAKSGARRQVYFEVETGLLAGREAETEHMVVYSDYRDFEGVQLPTRMTFHVPDTGDEELIQIEKAVWDAVDPSVFARPSEVLRLLLTPEQIEAANQGLREAWGKYFGKYELKEGPMPAVYTLDASGGSLTVDIENMRAFPLAEPDEEGRFYFLQMEIYVVFDLGDDGVPTAMVMHNAPGAPGPITIPRVDEDDGGEE